MKECEINRDGMRKNERYIEVNKENKKGKNERQKDIGRDRERTGMNGGQE